MKTHRWILAAPVVCALAACQHWDWHQPPRGVPKEDDCTQHSVKESISFYEQFLPPRGFYQFYVIPEPPDPKDEGLLPYSFVVLRVRDGRFPEQKIPVVERIIGPVRGKEEMTDLFSIFRRYASSPPIGHYCWQNDCRGKYSPAGDADPRDPYPPEIPDHPGVQVPVGYDSTAVPSGSYLLRGNPERGIGGSGQADAPAAASRCNFVPRDKTVLTTEVIENLRTAAGRVGRALDEVPEIPNVPTKYDPPYRQPPFNDPVKESK